MPYSSLTRPGRSDDLRCRRGGSTPFDERERIDTDSLRNLVDYTIDAGQGDAKALKLQRESRST